MANNIPKDILEPETASNNEPALFVATPNLALPEVSPALSLPENVLLSPEKEQRKSQIDASRLRGALRQPGTND